MSKLRMLLLYLPLVLIGCGAIIGNPKRPDGGSSGTSNQQMIIVEVNEGSLAGSKILSKDGSAISGDLSLTSGEELNTDSIKDVLSIDDILTSVTVSVKVVSSDISSEEWENLIISLTLTTELTEDQKNSLLVIYKKTASGEVGVIDSSLLTINDNQVEFSAIPEDATYEVVLAEEVTATRVSDDGAYTLSNVSKSSRVRVVTLNITKEDDLTAVYKVISGSNCPTSSTGFTQLGSNSSFTADTSSMPDGSVSLCVFFTDALGDVRSDKLTWIKDIRPSVEPAYNNASLWNEWVDATGRVIGDDIGDGSISAVHGGAIRAAKTGLTSCSGLSLTDNLSLFNWHCSVEGGEAVFRSRLMPGKGLQDLITHGSPTGSWKSMKVSLSGAPEGSLESVSKAWWDNNVKEAPDSSGSRQTLSEAFTIYTLNGSASTKGYTISGKGAALVGISDPLLTSAVAAIDCSSGTGTCVVDLASFSPWLEGVRINAQVTPSSMSGVLSSFLASRPFIFDVNVFNSNNIGIEIKSSGRAMVLNSRATNNTFAGLKIDSSVAIVHGFTATNNGTYGIQLLKEVVVSDIVASNNQTGLHLSLGSSSYDSGPLSALTVVNNSMDGIKFDGGGVPERTILHNNLALNNLTGIAPWYSADPTISQSIAVGNGTGIFITYNNDSQGKNGLINGNLVLGSNTTNCTVDASSDGFNISNDASGDCSPTLGLTVPMSNASVDNTTLGKASSTANTHGINDIAANSITDWSTFSNRYQGWGISGSAFGNTDHRGRCTSATNCRVWDFRLTSSDPLARNNSESVTSSNNSFTAGSTCPPEVAGSNTLQNYQGTKTYLKNAIEMPPTAGHIGNNNGLCEQGEHCLYTPNFGAYQGEGDVVECQYQSNGGLTGIRVFGYSVNGR